MAHLLLRSARAGVGLGTTLRLAAAQPGAAVAARCFAAQADAAAAKVWAHTGNRGGSACAMLIDLHRARRYARIPLSEACCSLNRLAPVPLLRNRRNAHAVSGLCSAVVSAAFA